MKRFMTIEEQASILESRGIQVDDIKILKEMNYAHIIYRYGSFYIKSLKNDIPIYFSGCSFHKDHFLIQ